MPRSFKVEVWDELRRQWVQWGDTETYPSLYRLRKHLASYYPVNRKWQSVQLDSEPTCTCLSCKAEVKEMADRERRNRIQRETGHKPPRKPLCARQVGHINGPTRRIEKEKQHVRGEWQRRYAGGDEAVKEAHVQANVRDETKPDGVGEP